MITILVLLKNEAFYTRPKSAHSYFMYECKYITILLAVSQTHSGVNSGYMCLQRHLICIQREMLHLVEE